MSDEKKRVCIIGSGPCGMSVLCQFDKLKKQGKVIPEVACYDKQSDWGGLWRYSWRTGMQNSKIATVVDGCMTATGIRAGSSRVYPAKFDQQPLWPKMKC
jgi:cation diffusion facilitator CzcD-associated flavoprotein CzcO